MLYIMIYSVKTNITKTIHSFWFVKRLRQQVLRFDETETWTGLVLGIDDFDYHQYYTNTSNLVLVFHHNTKCIAHPCQLVISFHVKLALTFKIFQTLLQFQSFHSLVNRNLSRQITKNGYSAKLILAALFPENKRKMGEIIFTKAFYICIIFWLFLQN